MARGRPSRETVYRRLESSVADIHARFGGLPTPEEAAGIWSDIWHLEAHHSTALEGNTLILRQVEVLLDEGRSVGAKPLKDYLEAQFRAASDSDAAVSYTLDFDPPLAVQGPSADGLVQRLTRLVSPAAQVVATAFEES